LGVDCCDAFLEFGRKDAKTAGIANIRFLAEDVQTYPFEPVHDFCFSRFGTQFFENPVAGLRNMRKSLKPGGIMTMIVWRGIKDNPWLGSAKDVVLGCRRPAKMHKLVVPDRSPWPTLGL
jgi:ubiquinone/menaquinone biosynthesis C-methylase UbiE